MSNNKGNIKLLTATQREAPFRFSTLGKAPDHTQEHQTRLKKLVKSKHDLITKILKLRTKKFYNICAGVRDELHLRRRPQGDPRGQEVLRVGTHFLLVLLRNLPHRLPTDEAQPSPKIGKKVAASVTFFVLDPHKILSFSLIMLSASLNCYVRNAQL